MKVLKSIIRVFAASVNVVAASLQMIKGGGGALENARVKSRFAALFSGVMFAVFGVFAAAVSESANAQTAAVGQVYSPVGMVSVRVGRGVGPTVDGDDSLAAVVLSISTFRSDNGFPVSNADWVRNWGADDVIDGLPAFNGVATQAGDVIRFYDRALFSNPTFDYTVRIFTDGTDLFMARGEGDAAPNVVAIRTTATLAANEFFILGDTGDSRAWTTVTVLESGVVGFRAATCTGDDMVSDDMLMCRPPTDAECMEKEPPQRLNTASEECENIPPPPPTCAADNTAADCTCPVDETRQMSGSTYMCVADSENPPGNGDTGGGSGGGGISDSGDGRNHAPVFVFGGLMLMGAVGYIMSGGDLDAFAFSPSFGYSATESGYSANVGGRVDFQKDEWTLFYTGGQTNANGKFGDFRYASGGEYKADFWQASFSESVQGETADYDLSLSADLSGGIWSLSPVYRLHSRLEEGETETRNSLNLEGVLEYKRWTIRQSAGFGWRRAAEFGDSAKFRLEAVRDF